MQALRSARGLAGAEDSEVLDLDLPNTELVVWPELSGYDPEWTLVAWPELSDAPARTVRPGPMAKPFAAAPLGIDTMQASHLWPEGPRPPFGTAHVSLLLLTTYPTKPAADPCSRAAHAHAPMYAIQRDIRTRSYRSKLKHVFNL
jgi:hypothetical protein